jgi:hypothetical protein
MRCLPQNGACAETYRGMAVITMLQALVTPTILFLLTTVLPIEGVTHHMPKAGAEISHSFAAAAGCRLTVAFYDLR